ncbi:DUF4157 domain-containing protein [uncultured Kordia sp.]|uniref:eCIS core domain-containing protein n=1 Tax=uncultured Kordia sp. TaxID=507699 RepID=UPI00260C25C3|nr:DUF4157 domain-containing protein [uncultured Kordia sp.]
MKAERKNKQPQEKTNNVIQRKEGKSFVKPKGDSNSFAPPKTSGKQNKSLPAKLQSNMESSLGHDFSNVGIHTNSQKAVQMKARAFTQSEQIHFAPGEFNPSSTSGQNLIGHEFTHIAQQRAGIVKPTKALKKGVMINDDRGLESEADNFGRKAVRGEAVSKYRSTGLGMRSSVRTAQAKSNVMQMVSTSGGDWKTDTYALRKNKDPYGAVSAGSRGVDIALRFTPKHADAELIGLTQSVNTIINGKVNAINPTVKGRSISAKDAKVVNGQSEEGLHIDRSSSKNNPIYGTNSLAKGDGLEKTPMDNNSSGKALKLGVTGGGNATYSLGYRKKVGKGWSMQDALLYDGPTTGGTKNSSQIFETTALALKGNQEGMYYGSVQWGWKTDAKGIHTKVPFKKVNDGVPTVSFMRAAKLWNASKSSGGAETANLPLQWTGTIHNTPLAALRTGKSAGSQILADIPRGATLTVLNDSSSWLRVQLDKTQAGIVLNRHGQAAVITGNLIRGYISKELVNKDASYR